MFMQDKGFSNRVTLAEAAEAPPCCGSGCAVCVLDYWDGGEIPQEVPKAQCCNSGCTVCVLDYAGADDCAGIEGSLLRLLDAVEEAQIEARTITDRS